MKRLLLLLAALAAASFTSAAEAPTPAAPAAKEKSPSDMAWDAVMALSRQKPMDALSVMNGAFDAALKFPDTPRSAMMVSGLEGLDNQMKDDAEKVAYQGALAARIAQMLAQPGLPEALKAGLMAADYAQFMTVQKRAAKPDVAAVRAKIDALATAYPQARQLTSAELAFGDLLAKSDPAAGAAHLKKLARAF